MQWRRGGEERVPLQSFFTSAIYRDEWSASRPGHFTPGTETRYPLDSRPVWTFYRQKSMLTLWGFELPIAYPVARSLYGLCCPTPVYVYVHIYYIAIICIYREWTGSVFYLTTVAFLLSPASTPCV